MEAILERLAGWPYVLHALGLVLGVPFIACYGVASIRAAEGRPGWAWLMAVAAL